ncbi:alpha-keto acid decarboxylase family protein [Fructilactobacillus carniphilus]|uniref:Alpha-keto-acid decarboxylase n=1 Tax=Fructilactobacillus carniphilus TaxID=2940297 RepID=A0ABY5C101_9LACO|nr:thiamine pyrophosphate-binding protein [Fructilactobacillus carniphilus]USS90970.1 thiamine pyrophosphate-binding protein [Fructilactobacillus carniphilus]
MNKYTISDYLLDVLHFGKVYQVLGVPGDYNLSFLDHITSRTDMEWCGNLNELNAAYAADGYARQQGLAAFVTTYGVGELSAINGLTGSQTEGVPLLEIVGLPTTANQLQRKRVHHSLGNGNFKHFQAVHQELGITTGIITATNAVTVVNQLLRKIITTKQPAYLELPCDLTELPVNPAFKQLIPALFKPSIDLDLPLIPQTLIKQALKQAKQPLVIVGQEIEQFQLGPVVQTWLEKQKLPFVDLIDSKGVVAETSSQFRGTYHGQLSKQRIQEQVQQADVLFLIGTIFSDVNTAGFSQQIQPEKMIMINTQSVSVYGEKLIDQPIGGFSAWIHELCDAQRVDKNENSLTPTHHPAIEPVPVANQPLTQTFYQKALAQFLQPHDTVVIEQGTSLFTIEDVRLPSGVKVISQPLWASIGYALPAALGSQLANPNRRHLLSIGDGSLLLTIQELAFAIEQHLTPIIFLLDNHGYTIERVIHGERASYNDVPQLNYQHLLPALGAKPKTYRFMTVKTETELMSTLTNLKEATPKLTIVQICLAKTDAPQALRKFVDLIYGD